VAKFVGRSITREVVRRKQGPSFLHKASAVAVVLIEVGVVAAGHGAVHAASAGGLGCAYNRQQHLYMQRDLVADTVRHPALTAIRKRKASRIALFKQNHDLGALRVVFPCCRHPALLIWR
jgi:L-aminopeptidase/D-esterase-like protein